MPLPFPFIEVGPNAPAAMNYGVRLLRPRAWCDEREWKQLFPVTRILVPGLRGIVRVVAGDPRYAAPDRAGPGREHRPTRAGERGEGLGGPRVPADGSLRSDSRRLHLFCESSASDVEFPRLGARRARFPRARCSDPPRIDQARGSRSPERSVTRTTSFQPRRPAR